ncbi:nuclear transport factor 2 family protein [Rhodopseudomonas boonkerdii]|uniref:nuclear transport factor 2 family protein n=1 Tax=Rhodopseudomonas boonkerdii TaxID=475937 RepID=UPI001E4C871D|nr:nuclear transport factor 2 family protein [Rhodopseudomonas boonkerdii]UGV24966.1 nuclear transport factor 2 family protein [Rhodopseudomonas boonkerdii]
MTKISSSCFAGARHMLLIAAAFLTVMGPAHGEITAHDPGAQTYETAMEKRNKDIVQEAFDKWRKGTYVFAALLAPDVVWTIHGSGPVAGTYRSQVDFVERASRPLTSRLASPVVPEVHGIYAVGDTVLIRFDGSATTTSGAPYRNRFLWMLRMKDGLVIEAEAFLDLVAYQQVIENNEPRRQ